jgi:hypothetical protein
MEAIKKIIVHMLMFWKWKIWTSRFWEGKTEYVIGFYAAIAWIGFEMGGRFLGWQTYPVGFFQKIAFGILAMSVISGVGWIWIEATFPELKKLIDPDSLSIQFLSQWEKIKLALFFWGFYVGGTVLLASLY